MAIANLHETILTYKLRKNTLQQNMAMLTSQKTLALTQQSELMELKMAEEADIKAYYQGLYDEDECLQCEYDSYADIEAFKEAMFMIQAKNDDQLAELTAWEMAISNQITTDSTEIAEIDAYVESFKGFLSHNLSNDYNVKLN